MQPVTARVTLVRYTPDAELVVAAAARLCYAAETDGLMAQDPEGVRRLVARLRRMGHLSPIEHVGFTFYLEGVSRAMSHQLVRHRIASYSQRSQRYVDHDGFDYVVPPQLAGHVVDTPGGPVPATEYFIETMGLIAARYAALNDALGRRGEASNEDARYVLPNACETRLFVTMNGRELLHFFEERLCLRAQWEIRDVAGRMLDCVREVCPAVFAGVGPKCVRRGGCPEGKMSCGRYIEMLERYDDESGGAHDATGTPAR
ncbi:MAG TPA: FAD-dependent thymidylate synthase [Armatimonadota bacterium]|nr:FAD-dependent thymidylate synthase [Armatimonadota bacterium]